MCSFKKSLKGMREKQSQTLVNVAVVTKNRFVMIAINACVYFIMRGKRVFLVGFFSNFILSCLAYML